VEQRFPPPAIDRAAAAAASAPSRSTRWVSVLNRKTRSCRLPVLPNNRHVGAPSSGYMDVCPRQRLGHGNDVGQLGVESSAMERRRAAPLEPIESQLPRSRSPTGAVPYGTGNRRDLFLPARRVFCGQLPPCPACRPRAVSTPALFCPEGTDLRGLTANARNLEREIAEVLRRIWRQRADR